MVFALGLASTALGCVDGVTPDCSDASVCAPSERAFVQDASGDANASTDTDAGSLDASSDAAHDGG